MARNGGEVRKVAEDEDSGHDPPSSSRAKRIYAMKIVHTTSFTSDALLRCSSRCCVRGFVFGSPGDTSS